MTSQNAQAQLPGGDGGKGRRQTNIWLLIMGAFVNFSLGGDIRFYSMA